MTQDIYKICPTYKNTLITLRKTKIEDAEGLLRCYSDEKAVPFFNSDNCHGDNFHYTTKERIEEAIQFWESSYSNVYFIRWTIILNSTKEIIGTIEMFHRYAEDKFNHCGILRMDLQSKHEKQQIIESILSVVNEFFYEAFQVKTILTKCIPAAKERAVSLNNAGYKSINEKFMIYDDYYSRENTI